MATAVAAIMARARREVDQLFFDNDAFSPDRAVEFEARMPVQQRYLEQLIAEGIVHEPSQGRYWMDLRAYEESRRQRMRAGLWIAGFAIVVIAVVSAAKTWF
ncbi:MAG TPA: hypothetical protein VNS53_03975 [Sphingomicrobium sp.]|jgi:hypothetical protein|nr:hypothetical protein [Sphingomicrobium sp.]